MVDSAEPKLLLELGQLMLHCLRPVGVGQLQHHAPRKLAAGPLKDPQLDQLVDRGDSRLHVLGPLLGPLQRSAQALQLVRDAPEGLLDLYLGLGGAVACRDDLLPSEEGVDLACHALVDQRQSLLLSLQLVYVPFQGLELLDRRLAERQSMAGMVLAAGEEGAPCLLLEARKLAPRLGGLRLELLPGAGDVGPRTTHGCQQLALSVVRYYEDVARVLRRREQGLQPHLQCKRESAQYAVHRVCT